VKQEDYILGTTDEEIERLKFQHDLWKQDVEGVLDLADVGLGQQVLDLGCGPGFGSIDLAERVGVGGKVYAIDASEKYLQFLKGEIAERSLNQVNVQRADVHQIPLPDGSVDVVFARWVLCFVERPEQVIAEIARVLRPGGRLVIFDYFNYQAVNIFPQRESFTQLFNAYYQSLIDQGGTYDIGHLLPEVVTKQGLDLESLKPVSKIGRPGDLYWKWFMLFTKSYLPTLVEGGYFTETDRETLLRDLNDAAKQPATFFSPPPVIGIVARKP
jgi:ubiquinone/menaquinone biosynthesis C-methylase UbiE